MRILPIINRLKAECPLLANRVEVAQSLTSLSDDEINTGLPIAFIYSKKENATASELINKTSQRVHKRFCVIIAAENSDGVSEPLEDVRDQIRAALTGWQPDVTHDPCEFVDGEVLDVSKRMIWWYDTYITFNYNRG
jgi:hypothetical protein